jgi:hypothetical protein
MLRVTMAIFAILDLFFLTSAANAGDVGGLTIVSGQFGRPGGAHWIDISARLQGLCGTQGTSCDIWCARETFGGGKADRHAVCRTIYRCPDGSTRSSEAGREEPILMRCPDGDADDRKAITTGQH